MPQDQTNFSTSHMTILRFPAFSGGNFICNCLGLSRHAVLKHALHAKHVLTHPDDYEYRLRAVMSTLPDHKLGASELIKWTTHYEWSDHHLYSGVDLTNWNQWARASSSDELVTKMSNSSLDFYMLLHTLQITKNVLQVWPNARIIQLVNVEKFWGLATQLKDPRNRFRGNICNAAGHECREKYESLAGDDWPSWKDFEYNGYNIDKFQNCRPEIIQEIKQFYHWYQVTNPVYLFDIDSNIFDETKFMSAIKILYEQLGYDDFDLAPILPFYQAYMRLHLDL